MGGAMIGDKLPPGCTPAYYDLSLDEGANGYWRIDGRNGLAYVCGQGSEEAAVARAVQKFERTHMTMADHEQRERALALVRRISDWDDQQEFAEVSGVYVEEAKAIIAAIDYPEEPTDG